MRDIYEIMFKHADLTQEQMASGKSIREGHVFLVRKPNRQPNNRGKRMNRKFGFWVEGARSMWRKPWQ